MEQNQEYAIGIDLGTTFSCIGVYQNNKVEIIVNQDGKTTTPSVVAFKGKNKLVGEGAISQAHRNAEHTVFDAKRMIGRKFQDPNLQEDIKLWPFIVENGKGNMPYVKIRTKDTEATYTPEQISAFILENLK